MSVENVNTELNGGAPDPGMLANITADDDALSAIFDKHERDHGAERENGKFVSPDPERRNAAAEAAAGSEGGDGKGEELEPGSSTPAATTVSLPGNWTGRLEEVWGRIAPEDQAKIAAVQTELQGKLSDQGRVISTFKPISEVLERQKDYFDGRYKTDDGKAITPAAAVEFFFNVQRELDRDPVTGLLNIADRYGARDQLAAALGTVAAGKEGQQGDAALQSEIAGLKAQIRDLLNPASIDARINQQFSARAAVEAAGEEVSRLAKDKPLYSEIPEEDMVQSIHKARRKLGDAASKEAVFDLAYDMAVNADPDLRAKAAAARPAAVQDPKKIADAKRAAGVNVTSTQSGRARTLSEEEELGEVYDRHKRQ